MIGFVGESHRVRGQVQVGEWYRHGELGWTTRSDQVLADWTAYIVSGVADDDGTVSVQIGTRSEMTRLIRFLAYELAL